MSQVVVSAAPLPQPRTYSIVCSVDLFKLSSPLVPSVPSKEVLTNPQLFCNSQNTGYVDKFQTVRVFSSLKFIYLLKSYSMYFVFNMFYIYVNVSMKKKKTTNNQTKQKTIKGPCLKILLNFYFK